MDFSAFSNVVKATPVLSAPAYSTGDVLGGLLKFSGALRPRQTGLLVSCCITDLSKQDAPVDVVIFDQKPSNSTFTDNAAIAINALDVPHIAAIIHLLATNYVDFGSASSAAVTGLINQALKLLDGVDLYGVLVVRGPPTYAGASDLGVALGIIQD